MPTYSARTPRGHDEQDMLLLLFGGGIQHGRITDIGVTLFEGKALS